MHDTLPLKLYSDLSKVVPGKAAVVRWTVLNCTDEAIVSLRIALQPQGQNSKMVGVDDFKREHLPIEPHSKGHCQQGLIISESGEFPVEVFVSVRLAGGRRFDFVVDPQPSLEIVERGGEGELRVKLGKDSNCILKLPSGEQKNLNYEAGDGSNLILDRKTIGGVEKSVSTMHAPLLQSEDLQGREPLPLRLLSPEGLSPLDLARFAKAWPGKQGDLQLCFVNQKGEERGATTELLFPYRLRVKVTRAGYLTLLARDADGKYYILAPNTHAPQAILLKAHQTVSLPGELLPIPKVSGAEELAFNAIGEEAVVALLTTRPLHAPEDPLKEWSEKQIADILGSVCNNQSDASLAFVRIRVEPVRHKS